MAIPSIIPNLHIYLNAVTLFLMLGEPIYLYLSRTTINSSKSYFLAGIPSGSDKSSPTSSLVASITIAKLVAVGVLLTYFPMKAHVPRCKLPNLYLVLKVDKKLEKVNLVIKNRLYIDKNRIISRMMWGYQK